MSLEYSNFTTHQLHIIRFYSIEFASTYKSAEGRKFLPITLKNYILGFQRAF